MKPVTILMLITLFLIAILGCNSVRAQNELEVTRNSVEADFPASLEFSLSVESDVTISDIRLFYTVDKRGFAQVVNEVYVEFDPDVVVDAKWLWDMRKIGGLPPGSRVNHWWIVKDISGNEAKTEPASIYFDDSRFSWRELTEDGVTIYWYIGDDSFAREIMAAAQKSLFQLNDDIGATLERPIRIYVYANARDLQSAMIYPQEWTGGAAFTRFDTITIGITPGNLQWGRRALTHELTHLVVHQLTFNPYRELPAWLDEGLAMYAEGNLSSPFISYLDEAMIENTLISVRSLSSPFSVYAETAMLAYAQSYSIVEFLIEHYGQDQILELLNTFRNGSDYDTALQRVYGFDMDGLNNIWRDYLDIQYTNLFRECPQFTKAG